jgi:hypothetical protein
MRARWLYLLILPVLALAGFLLWAGMPLEPMPEALEALKAGPEVQVSVQEGRLVFLPEDEQPVTGFIFYPGGRVDPRAYAPAARAIASQGYLVALVPMPLNLAVFGADRAASVMESFPEIDRWAVGGHSLGGSMAARFARQHPDRVAGLVLWASYPADIDDLSGLDLRAASIYGTDDGLADQARLEGSRDLLPTGTRWTAVKGGNHAQFGWYGQQPGDKPAGISRQEQQEQVLLATLELLADLK